MAAVLIHGGLGAINVPDQASFKGSHGSVRNLPDSNSAKVFEHKRRSTEDAQKGDA